MYPTPYLKNTKSNMIETLLDLLQYRFFSNALLAAFFASIACGIIGTYIVSRRIVFISGGITHASFGGIGISYYYSFDPIAGAAVFAVLSALGIQFMKEKTQVREDSLIGILWSLGMAVGIIFVFITPGYAPDLMGYLFGSIMTVSGSDLTVMGILTFVIALFFILFYKPVLFISFDQEYAKTHRAPVKLMNFILITLVALTVVLSIKVAGVILVLSLLTIPQTTANIFSHNFRNIMLFSILVAFAGCFAGLLISFELNIPSGASIIFSLIVIFIIAKLFDIITTHIKIVKSIKNNN